MTTFGAYSVHLRAPWCQHKVLMHAGRSTKVCLLPITGAEQGSLLCHGRSVGSGSVGGFCMLLLLLLIIIIRVGATACAGPRARTPPVAQAFALTRRLQLKMRMWQTGHAIGKGTEPPGIKAKSKSEPCHE